jgi:tRNA A-37 threonylcarbamoyl transferase component Bud32
LLRALARHRAKVRRGPKALEHRGRYSTVSRVRLEDGTEVAVKWNHTRGLHRAIAEGLRGSRARRAVAGTARVHAIGLAAPRIVAWGERRSFAAVRESFLVTGFVTDSEPLPAAISRLRGARAERRDLARRLGEMIGRLHAAGLDHHDLKHSNLLWCADATLVVLDLEALERCAWLSRRRRVRALGQLEAYVRHLYPWLPKTDRLRFLHVYLRHAGFAAAKRRVLVRGVSRWADARIRDWGQRIR